MVGSVVKQFSFMRLIIIFFISILSANAQVNNIPDDLKPWVQWVLKDQPNINCPIIYNRNQNICAYPGFLSIDVQETMANFEQRWDVYAKAWITLPGDNKNWPEKVSVNEKKYPVVAHNGKPSILLDKGHYLVDGKLNWHQKPKYISIPVETGVISLSLSNKKINLPDFRQGKLWLDTENIKIKQDSFLELQVYRKISDTIPLEVTTQIKLNVAGQQREIMLNGMLLADFQAIKMTSQLPSQIDENGGLKIQIRPGQWVVEITSLNQQLLNKISLPEFKSPWPKNEIWVLDQKTDLRMIKVINKNSIDSNQTRIPDAWKKFPAYSVKQGEILSFDEIKRGNPNPEPDQLTLRKKLWLDFDGKGFTVNDKIEGKLSSNWRLNVTKEMKLGQVTLNGKPQFITRDKNQSQGVEVRHGNLKLLADSRIENNAKNMMATGWDMDFNEVTANLYLPAGWQLLSISGATTNTWVDQWTLLDFFMVLITAIVIYKMWGVLWGALGLITLILIWHEAMSPQYIWINLALSILLIRSLPEGCLIKWVQGYRLLASLVLVIILCVFIVGHAKMALYPQLAFANEQINTVSYKQNDQPALLLEKMEAPQPQASRAYEENLSSIIFENDNSLKRSKRQPQYRAEKRLEIDPDAMIQTGPGLPLWTLNQYHLYWDGPVKAEQKISMTLLSPSMHSILNIIRIALIMLLAWRLLDIKTIKPVKIVVGKKPSDKLPQTIVSSVIIILMSGMIGLSPIDAQAAFPQKELLDELKNELLKPADCLPDCASIESMNIKLSNNQVRLKIKVHAQENIIIPLPIPVKQWMPSEITIDNKKVSGLIRRKNETLWLNIDKGTHEVMVKGDNLFINELSFIFPLKPHKITTNLKKWTVQGFDKQAHKITVLSFLRTHDKNKKIIVSKKDKNEIPAYAEVSRALELGLDWQIKTIVKGLSDTHYPIVISVPLLTGESVITDNIKIENKHAIITLPNKYKTVTWLSSLGKKDSIKLKASESAAFTEKWSLLASPIWHIEYDGIPVIYHQRDGDIWQPEWQPWPGESVTINLSRPQGVAGKTMTIDKSRLVLTPGEMITKATLQFNIRSSSGGQHVIKLPDNITLQTVSVNNQNIPLQQIEQGLSIPISPGNQMVEINWRENRGISGVFNSSKINLGDTSVNNTVSIEPGENRWVIFAYGPTMGPAVLFWGMFIVIILIAVILGRIKDVPLSTLHWLLLGIGLSASQPWAFIIIAICIFALRYRASLDIKNISYLKFNSFQVLLAYLMFFTITSLIGSIEQGLLGSPEMQISGNGSNEYILNWYSDRINEDMPISTFISIPVYVYQLMMLVWSIWLAFALIKWAMWSWNSFSKDEYWLSKKVVKNDG